MNQEPERFSHPHFKKSAIATVATAKLNAVFSFRKRLAARFLPWGNNAVT
jgi:hypothetical protein